MTRRKRRIIVSSLVITSLFLTGVSIYLLFFVNMEAYERQETEESIADVFIEDLIESVLAEETSASAQQEESAPVNFETVDGSETVDQIIVTTAETEELPHKTYNDDTYFSREGITYTPDYASGYLFCVLEYPALNIRRGVYSGTWNDINVDLDIWMATTSRPDYELGNTHVAIYGHNHTSQNLSFNNLKNAQLGDEFILYAASGVYTYTVTNIFSESRSTVTTRYVDNFGISADICYIITCGRDNFLINGASSRYKDFIVEGHIKDVKSISEYAKMIMGEEEDWKR